MSPVYTDFDCFLKFHLGNVVDPIRFWNCAQGVLSVWRKVLDTTIGNVSKTTNSVDEDGEAAGVNTTTPAGVDGRWVWPSSNFSMYFIALVMCSGVPRTGCKAIIR
jgi:hypothetical protein